MPKPKPLDDGQMATLLTQAEEKIREQRQEIARLKVLCKDLFVEVMCDDDTEAEFRARLDAAHVIIE